MGGFKALALNEGCLGGCFQGAGLEWEVFGWFQGSSLQ